MKLNKIESLFSRRIGSMNICQFSSFPAVSEQHLGWPWCLGVYAMVIMGLLGGCSKATQTGEVPGGPGKMAMPVTVIEARLQRVPVIVEAVGQTEGSKEVEVRARAAGILAKQLYSEGDPVTAGATLFTIDRVPYENALAQARAALAQDKASVEKRQRECGRTQ